MNTKLQYANIGKINDILLVVLVDIKSSDQEYYDNNIICIALRWEFIPKILLQLFTFIM